MSTTAWIVLPIAAVLTAMVSAILGMAGGMALLGVMTALLPAPAVVPLHGVVQLGSNVSRTVVLLRSVRWGIVGIYAPALVAGMAGGSLLWSGNLSWFQPAIGVFILAFLLYRRRQPRLRTVPSWAYAPLGLVTGLMTMFVGATGPFIAPFFLRDDLEREPIVGTMAVCQSLGHLLKIPAFVALGFDFLPHLPLLALLVACVAIGTWLGRRVLGRISERSFTAAFEVVLAAVALYLVVRSLLVG